MILMGEIDVAAGTAFEGVAFSEGKPAVHEARTFELPRSIWAIMFASYGLFFGALAIAAGGTFDALGMIIIGICYTIMYFGTAIVMTRVAKKWKLGELSVSVGRHSATIETLTGPLSYGAAVAQILTVPVLFAFFGVCIAIISTVILPR